MTFHPVTSITLACTRTANLLFFLCLMVLSAGRNYQYPDLPVPEHKNTFQSTSLSSLTVTYRLAVEYTYLLRRPVSTGSNKQTTANTQITAWVSLWLTLLTSWFVFTLVLKNYRKMWNTFRQKQSAVYWSVTVTNNISLSMQVSSQVSS